MSDENDQSRSFEDKVQDRQDAIEAQFRKISAVVGLVSSEWHESQLHKNSSKPQSFVVSVCSFSDSLDSLC